MFAPPFWRRRCRNNAFRFRHIRRRRRQPADIAASGASDQTERDPQRAERAVESRIARRCAEEKRGDMLFVPERRRSRRAPERDPQRAERAVELSCRA
jgi:hypothetical protein